MTGKTHRVGGMLSCFIGYTLLKSHGMLVKDVNPLLQVTIMYPFALWGSTLPDLDHGAESIPSKDIVSIGINRLLHLTTKARRINKGVDPMGILDAKHRSWQTHSDIFLGIFIYLFIHFMNLSTQTADVLILRMVLSGLSLGIISHMILDMLTPEGIWLVTVVVVKKIFPRVPLPVKVHLVPKSAFFATDGKWESVIRVIMWVLNVILLALVILDTTPYRITFNF